MTELKVTRSLVASAKRITAKDIKGPDRKKSRSGGSWQSEAWDMYDMVGEQRFLVNTLAGRMSKARLFVGRINQREMTDSPEPVNDERINRVLQAFGRTIAGRSQLIERMAVNLSQVGEGWYVGIPTHLIESEENLPEGYDSEALTVEDFHWRMLSTSEVTTTSGGRTTLNLDGNPLEVDADGVYLIRVWKPHPKEWWEADSATRATLPVLKEIVGLTLHIASQIESRLAGAGLLVIAESMQSAINRSAGLREDATQDLFTEALMTAMLTPIEDRGSAAAVVPLVVTAPDDAVDKVQFITFSKPLDGQVKALRDDAIRRLALGQDAPPELLLGTAGMNHWGGWLVQEDVVATHLEPPLALICDALTTQYLWPVLEGMGIDNPDDYVIWYDVSNLVVRPNRLNEAMQLFDKKVISAEALRREAGFDESDAPDPGDPAKEILLGMIQSNPGMLRLKDLNDIVDRLKEIVSGQNITREEIAVEELPEETAEPSESSEAEPTEPAASPIPVKGPGAPSLPEQT